MKKYLYITIILLIACTALAASYKPYAFPFIGRWQPAEDPVLIDDYGFQNIQNLRKDGKRLKGVSGHTKINTLVWDASYSYPENGFHFKKSQPAESHVIVSARDASGENPTLYQNTTAIPSQGEFEIDFDNETNKIVTDYSLDAKEFSDWSNLNSADTAESTTAPDDTLTGVKLTEDSTASANHGIYYSGKAITDDTPYTWSVFCKGGTKNRLVMAVREAAPNTDVMYLYIDLSAGTVSTSTNGDVTLSGSSITQYPNDWYLATLTGQFGSAASNQHDVLFFMTATDSDWTVAYNGDGASYIYIWGAKMTETSSYLSESKILYTASTSASLGRMCSAPKGNMIYCNGEESLIWGGDELICSSFIVTTASPSLGVVTAPKDYTEQVMNTRQTRDEVAQIANGLDASTVLMLHCDGADETTTFTDSSDSGHTPSAQGDSKLDTDYKRFGQASGIFDRTGDYITIPDHADWNFGSDAFTIDFWVRFTEALQNPYPLFEQYEDDNNFTRCTISQVTGTYTIYFEVEDANTEQLYIYSTWPGFAANTWFHFAIVRGWGGGSNNVAIVINGTELASSDSYSGTVPDLAGTFDIGRQQVGTDAEIEAHIDEFRVSKGIARWTSDFTLPIRPYKNIGKYWLVGSPRPLQGVKFYISKANLSTSTMSAWEWNGSAWDELTITDNTASGGISLAQTGTVTWSSTEDTSRTTIFEGLSLYWYLFNIDAGEAEIYHCTVDAPIQEIKNVWSTDPATCAGFHVYDGGVWENYSLHVNTESSEEYSTEDFAAELDALADTEYVYAAFTQQMQGINVSMTEHANANAATVTVYYWDGNDWVTVGTVTDGTAVGGNSLSQDGIIAWQPPLREEEFTRNLFGLLGQPNGKLRALIGGFGIGEPVGTGNGMVDQYGTAITKIIKNYLNNPTQLYYYKFMWSATLSADVLVDTVEGVPAVESINGYSFPVMYQERIFLFDEKAGDRNKGIYSTYNNPDTFNGMDSGQLLFGDNTPVIAATPLYNLYRTAGVSQLIVCKEHETYRVTGNDPETWEKYLMDENIGCIAPLSMVSCGFMETPDGIKRKVVIFQADNGVYATDGATIDLISKDIACYWDPNDSRCIPTARLDDSVGKYNAALNTYKLLISSGSGQTTHNVELEFSLDNREWTKIYRENGSGANPLQIAFNVHDTNGKVYPYGATNEGYMYRLENGNTWDGTGIEQYVHTKDLMLDSEQPLFKHTNINFLRLLFEDKATGAGEDIDIAHYCNQGLTTHDTNDQFVPTDIDMADGPHELRECTLGPCLYHSFKFTVTTSTVSDGMELTGLGLYYEPKKNVME